MYSKADKMNLTASNYDALRNQVIVDLKNFQEMKDKLVDSMGNIWDMSGVSETTKLIDLSDDKQELPPIAIYSKYGRRMISTQDLNELTGRNVYWAWKHKDFGDLDLNNDISIIEKERVIIDNIIQIDKKKREYTERIKDKASRKKEKSRSNALANLEVLQENYEMNSDFSRKTLVMLISIISLAFFMFGYTATNLFEDSKEIDIFTVLSIILTLISIVLSYLQYMKIKNNDGKIIERFKKIKRTIKDNANYYDDII